MKLGQAVFWTSPDLRASASRPNISWASFETAMQSREGLQSAANHRALGFSEAGLFGWKPASHGYGAKAGSPPVAIESEAVSPKAKPTPIAAQSTDTPASRTVKGRAETLPAFRPDRVTVGEIKAPRRDISGRVVAVATIAETGPEGEAEVVERLVGAALQSTKKDPPKAAATVTVHEANRQLQIAVATAGVSPAELLRLRSALAAVAGEFGYGVATLSLNGERGGTASTFDLGASNANRAR